MLSKFQIFRVTLGLQSQLTILLDSKNYINIVKFSLEYITNEKTCNKNVVIESRFGGHKKLEQRENGRNHFMPKIK